MQKATEIDCLRHKGTWMSYPSPLSSKNALSLVHLTHFFVNERILHQMLVIIFHQSTSINFAFKKLHKNCIIVLHISSNLKIQN